MNYVHGFQALGIMSILLAGVFLFMAFCAGIVRLSDNKPKIAVSIVIAVFVVIVFSIGATTP